MFVFVIKKKEKRDPLLGPRGGRRLLGNRFRCGFRGIAAVREQLDATDDESGDDGNAAGQRDHLDEGEVFLFGSGVGGGVFVFHDGRPFVYEDLNTRYKHTVCSYHPNNLYSNKNEIHK